MQEELDKLQGIEVLADDVVDLPDDELVSFGF
jgi:hypothetical protein